MEAQTGRYRLGLASNLTANGGCLEEMTPFLNHNKGLCALQSAHILMGHATTDWRSGLTSCLSFTLTQDICCHASKPCICKRRNIS